MAKTKFFRITYTGNNSRAKGTNEIVEATTLRKAIQEVAEGYADLFNKGHRLFDGDGHCVREIGHTSIFFDGGYFRGEVAKPTHDYVIGGLFPCGVEYWNGKDFHQYDDYDGWLTKEEAQKEMRRAQEVAEDKGYMLEKIYITRRTIYPDGSMSYGK